MALRVELSSDISRLAWVLGDVLQRDLQEGSLDLFHPASIIVPHGNLARWVMLRLAHQLGIAADLEFPYLESTLWQALAAHDAAPQRFTRLDATTLQRLIYALFMQPLLHDDPAMAPVWDYIGGGANPSTDWPADAQRRAWQLAERTARLYLEYECQRPAMTAAWLENRLLDDAALDPATERWQQRLYHAVFSAEGWRDRQLPQYRTLPQYRALIDPGAKPTDMRPLYLFGLGHTSPFHLDLLCDLARQREVHLFLCLPPTARVGEHELLARWGTSARQMLTMLAERETRHPHLHLTVHDTAAVTSPATLLATVQAAICAGNPATSVPQDRSLQVWACPGQHREVESVYQMILAQVDADPGLRLTDIAVLVTDMDAYLPTLHEVFGRQGRRIPYNLVDANAARISQYSAAVTALLNLVGSSFTRRDVFALLANPCYLATVGADMDMARQWLAWAAALGIFYSYRQEEKCQACDTGCTETCNTCRNATGRFDPTKLSEAYTWLAGLRRLRLGRIMTAPPTLPENGAVCAWAGAIPYADLETANLDALERFSFGVEALYRACAALTTGASSRSCREWRDAVRRLLDATLAIPEAMPQEAYIRTVLYEALEAFVALEPCFPDGVTLAMVREYVQTSLAEIPANYGRPLLDGITITSLRRGHLLPFRQIYVLGLGEGLFPGAPEAGTLDLRRGGTGEADLSVPDVNRQLFLDILLAAHDRLVLTYNCRDLAEDAELNPCSIITQLESYLERHVLPPGLRFAEAQAPLAGRSLQYLYQADADLPYDLLVNYHAHDRLMALAELAAHEASALSPTGRERLAGLLDAHQVEVQARITLPEPETAETATVRILVRYLADFLVNPAEARLKRQLYLADEEVDESAEQEIEPFASAYPTDQQLSSRVQERFVRRAVQTGQVAIDPAGFFKPCYDDAHQRSLTPDGIFAHLDAEKWERKFAESVKDGLGELTARLSAHPCRTVSLGMPRQGDATLLYPALPITTPAGSATVCGLLPQLWETDQGLETLLFTTSNRPERLTPDNNGRWQLVKHILPPLLTYIALQAGEAAGWIGGCPLTIHISYAKGIQSVSFAVPPAEAETYLQTLVEDYLGQRALDDLPLFTICGKDALWPLTEDMAPFYTERLQSAITEGLEGSYSGDASRMALLGLIDAVRTPEDAYALVARRLMPLYWWRVPEGEAG